MTGAFEGKREREGGEAAFLFPLSLPKWATVILSEGT